MLCEVAYNTFPTPRPNENFISSITLITEQAVTVYNTVHDYSFVHRPSSSASHT